MPYLETNGINMFYEEQGSGDPLLLIMGITAPGAVWEAHAEAWQEDRARPIAAAHGHFLLKAADEPAGTVARRRPGAA